MSTRFPSIFGFSKLAMVAVAVTLAFSHPSVAQEVSKSAQNWLSLIDNGEGIDTGFDGKEISTFFVGAVSLGIMGASDVRQYPKIDRFPVNRTQKPRGI